MNLGLINSAWAQAGKETAYGIWMTKEIGFDTIDIFADPLEINPMEVRLIKNECDRAGLQDALATQADVFVVLKAEKLGADVSAYSLAVPHRVLAR